MSCDNEECLRSMNATSVPKCQDDRKVPICSMRDVCQSCGDRGFFEALIYCDRCQLCAVHRYCLAKLPPTLDEYVVWLCDDCQSKFTNSSNPSKPTPLPGLQCNSESIRIKEEKKVSFGKLKKNSESENTTSSWCKHDVIQGLCNSASISNPKNFSGHNEGNKEIGMIKRFEERNLDEAVVPRESKVPQQKRNCENERKLPNLEEKCCSSEAPTSVKEEIFVVAQPIKDPIWRGRINPSSHEDLGLVGGLVAHISNLACSKATEAAKLLPRLLSSELLPRSNIWPKSFESGGPTDHSIALFFFPDSERNEKFFDGLVNDMIRQDLAMSARVQNAELLVFTSILLPMEHWRFQAKFYLWGVFKGKGCSP